MMSFKDCIYKFFFFIVLMMLALRSSWIIFSNSLFEFLWQFVIIYRKSKIHQPVTLNNKRAPKSPLAEITLNALRTSLVVYLLSALIFFKYVPKKQGKMKLYYFSMVDFLVQILLTFHWQVLSISRNETLHFYPNRVIQWIYRCINSIYASKKLGVSYINSCNYFNFNFQFFTIMAIVQSSNERWIFPSFLFCYEQCSIIFIN